MNNEKELLEIISKHFSESNLNLENWQNIPNNTDSNPSVFHLLSKVRYYVAYFSKNAAINLSMIMKIKNQQVLCLL